MDGKEPEQTPFEAVSAHSSRIQQVCFPVASASSASVLIDAF
jgi:hypothetical protein